MSYTKITKPTSIRIVKIDDLEEKASTINTLSNWKATIDEMVGSVNIYNKITKPTL